MLDSIYHMILILHKNCNLWWFIDLLHGYISHSDMTPCDKLSFSLFHESTCCVPFTTLVSPTPCFHREIRKKLVLVTKHRIKNCA